jgi:hypothetical protein
MQPKMLDPDPYQMKTGPKHWFLLIAKDSVVDEHRFDADPDPTYHFDDYPDPDPDSTLSFTTVENLIFCTSLKSKKSKPKKYAPALKS